MTPNQQRVADHLVNLATSWREAVERGDSADAEHCSIQLYLALRQVTLETFKMEGR